MALKPIHWSPKLGAAGELVTGVSDIAQCIRIILETPKGSDPLRPLFGSDHYKYLDRPLPAAVPLIVREAWDAIATWEPRAVVERIAMETAEARAVIVIYWHPADGEKTEVLRVG